MREKQKERERGGEQAREAGLLTQAIPRLANWLALSSQL